MNIDPLLEPITEDARCGVDLSFSVEFDRLQELRRSDDPTLPQGEFVTDLKTADWQAASDLCQGILTTRSKDLRVAGWLVEAWSHLHGFNGLASGLSLIDALCSRHWVNLQPLIDEGDPELRVGNLAWVLSRIEYLSGRVALLASGTRTLNRVQIDAARARPGVPGRPADNELTSVAEGGPTADDLVRLQRETPRSFLVANLAESRRALLALNALQRTVDALLGDDGPGFVSARNALDTAGNVAMRLAREAGATDDDSSTCNTSAGAIAVEYLLGVDAAPGSVRDDGLMGKLQTRPQAIQQLRNVAEFFRRTEPHSPVAYLADKAAKWGEMSLHDWLQAVVKDGAALAQLDDVLGITRFAGDSAAGV